VGCGQVLRAPARGDCPGATSGDAWAARGDHQHPSSLGQVCVKGATVGETLHRNRPTTPLWRELTDQPYTPISCVREFNLLVVRIRATLVIRGPEVLAIYGSGQFLCDDYYLATKRLKGALVSNNFDANSRLCMCVAVASYERSLGCDGPPCYDDLDTAA
jgi:ferredoxin-nitrate reductase